MKLDDEAGGNEHKQLSELSRNTEHAQEKHVGHPVRRQHPGHQYIKPIAGVLSSSAAKPNWGRDMIRKGKARQGKTRQEKRRDEKRRYERAGKTRGDKI